MICPLAGVFWRHLPGLSLALIVIATPASAARLTLETVLAQADAAHPELDLAHARSDLAQAEAMMAQSLNDFRVNLDASLRTGRNPIYNDQFQPDHQLRLNARKTLIDSGRQQASSQAADQERQARDLQLLDARAQRQIGLMARYFDVLLADMQDAAETEALAVAYVNWDNAKDRQALGQLAAWELVELEARFQDVLTRRNEVRRGLREKRMALGAAMNLPGMVLDDLVDPKLPGNERPLLGFDQLLTRVLAENPRLVAQKQLLAAASHRLAGARVENRPSVEFEAEAAAWRRDSSTRDDLRAGFNFSWPLWQGGRADARIGREQANFHVLQAQHDQLQQDLRLALVAASEEIQYLRDTARRSAEMNASYRDQYLEKARAEYEMELKTNLGNSMAETQFAQIRKRAIEYRLALAWARLDALLGERQPGLVQTAASHAVEEQK
jgi:outer membrane protein TolC